MIGDENDSPFIGVERPVPRQFAAQSNVPPVAVAVKRLEQPRQIDPSRLNGSEAQDVAHRRNRLLECSYRQTPTAVIQAIARASLSLHQPMRHLDASV